MMDFYKMLQSVKKYLWRWTSILMLMAVIFVLWGLHLLISVNHHQDEVAQCVTTINRLNSIEKTIQELDLVLAGYFDEPNGHLLRQRWNEKKNHHDTLRNQITKQDPLYTRIESSLIEMDLLIKKVSLRIEQESASAEEAVLQKQILLARKDLNQGIDRIKSAITAVRARSRELSILLSEKWTQLNILVVISCFLAILTAALLALYYNKSREYQAMDEQLKAAQKHLEENREAQHRILMKTINQISQIVSKLNVVMEQQTRALHEQSVALNQTSTTAQQISVTSQQSTQKAEMVATNAESSMQITQNSKISMDAAMQALSDIHRNSQQTLDHFRYLNEKMKMIESISATVKDIAKKTNILALNAGIEAFKAGDLGKGLAVVANEVKALAERSQWSAGEITDLVTDIQHAAENTLQSIQSGYQTVEESLRQMTEAVRYIDQTLEMLTENDSYTKQILVDQRQQVIGIDQLSQALDSINQVVKQIVQNTEQIKGTAETAKNLTKELRLLLNTKTIAAERIEEVDVAV